MILETLETHYDLDTAGDTMDDIASPYRPNLDCMKNIAIGHLQQPFFPKNTITQRKQVSHHF